MIILVRTVNRKGVRKDDEGRLYHSVEYHKVDLKERKIERHCYPRQWSCLKGCGMVQVGGLLPKVMLLCGDSPRLSRYSFPSFPYHKPTLFLVGEGKGKEAEDDDDDDVHYYNGSSFMDLDPVTGRDNRWEQGPLIPDENNAIYCHCACLSDWVYNFGYTYLSPMVLHPSEASWDPLPKTWPDFISGCQIAMPILTDHSTNRFLLRFYPSYLVAFYPPSQSQCGGGGGSWEVINTKFFLMGPAAAYYDGVIYVHDSDSDGHGKGQFLHAYHLQTHTYLDVVWSSLKIITHNGSFTHLHNLGFESLFSVGDGTFWFASWAPGHGVRPTYVVFFNFKAAVSLDDHNVICTPYIALSFELDCNSDVYEFMPLREVQEEA